MGDLVAAGDGGRRSAAAVPVGLVVIGIGELAVKDEITLQQKLLLLDSSIEYARRAGENCDVLKSIAKDIRALTREAQHSAFIALTHQIGAAKRQKARLGYVESGVKSALCECVLAHSSAILAAQAHFREVEQLRRTVEQQRELISTLEGDGLVVESEKT